MKKFIKLISLAITVCMLLVLCGGCGENATNSVDDVLSTVGPNGSGADNNSSEILSENDTSTESKGDNDSTSSGIVPDGYKDATSLLTYTISNGQVTITNCSFYATGKIMIPSIIDGYPVVTIGKNAFRPCDKIEGVYISEGIKKIEDEAFYNCIKLAEITLPNSLESIGRFVFRGCDLKSFHIPRGLKDIKSNILGLNGDMNKITIDPNNAYYYIKNNCVIEKATKKLVFSLSTSAYIPEETKIIGEYAFYRSWMKEIIIPNGVEEIGDYAFSDCYNCREIVIPDSVKKIGKYSFAGSQLTNVTLSKNITDIPEGAFSYNSMTDITIPNKVKYIGAQAFQTCKFLTSITIPESVKEIKEKAFIYCYSLETINLPNVVQIGNYAFNCCEKLSKVTVLNDLKNIGEYAFSNCTNLVEIVLPDGVTNIGKYAFEHCKSLEKFVIPNGVIVYDDFFYECTNLKEFTVPDSITTYIVDHSLSTHCENIEKIYFYSEAQMKLFKREFSVNPYIEYILIS